MFSLMTAKVPAKDNYKNDLKYKSISDLASMKTSMINENYPSESSFKALPTQELQMKDSK